jgi:hypothetical protein
MSQPVDPALCPLCGQPNACALAAAPESEPSECWCASRCFAVPLLARVPPASVGRACICRRCQAAAARAVDAPG